ncbi:MAG: hypothetical protein EOM91_20285 [Sphingobacteriia bacterium]|nr:hypothetical protein [Sphingobacteriia bacterium]
MRELICSRCGQTLPDYGHVAYDGPARDGHPDPGNEACDPTMDWMVLCKACAKALWMDEDWNDRRD